MAKPTTTRTLTVIPKALVYRYTVSMTLANGQDVILGGTNLLDSLEGIVEALMGLVQCELRIADRGSLTDTIPATCKCCQAKV